MPINTGEEVILSSEEVILSNEEPIKTFEELIKSSGEPAMTVEGGYKKDEELILMTEDWNMAPDS